MRLRVNKWSSRLHFVSGLEPEHFRLVLGKIKGSVENNTIDWKYAIFFCCFFSPKGNLGQISWVKLLKKKGWCDRELWGGHCHSHDQAHRPFLAFSWRLTSPVGTACLFKATGLPGKGSNKGSQPHWLNIGEEIWSNSHVPYRSRWDMNESAIHPCELPP